MPHAIDSDCKATVRSCHPSESHAGGQVCQSYALSSITPFDECEGESETTCMLYGGYCMSSTCFLRKANEIETE